MASKEQVLRLLQEKYVEASRRTSRNVEELEKERRLVVSEIEDAIPLLVEVKTKYGVFQVRTSTNYYGCDEENFENQIDKTPEIKKLDKEIRIEKEKWDGIQKEILRKYDSVRTRITLFGMDVAVRQDVEKFLDSLKALN